MSDKIVEFLVIGCGNRGEVYASYALKHPDRARIVGLAEKRAFTRSRLHEIYRHTISDESRVVADWRLINRPGLADSVIIALPDAEHKEAAVHFIRLGYNVLLEKPMATQLDDCKQIVNSIKEQNQLRRLESKPELINAVCHVLRYYGPCLKIKQLIESGVIGDVVNINHTEPVGYWHFAHSFVRGNWHNEKASSFSLLTKCCHDIDLIMYWMSAKKCTHVSSFGSLFYFNEKNAPSNSSDNCFNCPSEPECAYSAKRIYMELCKGRASDWPGSVVIQSEIGRNINDTDIEDTVLVNMSAEEKTAWLVKCLKNESTTQYGRCVFKMRDNDVCDNQVVNMEFDDGSTASLTMIAFSKDICQRKTKIYGTKGELEWDDSLHPDKIAHYDFLSGQSSLVDCSSASFIQAAESPSLDENVKKLIKLSGHGGTDYLLMHRFVEACLLGDQSLVLTDFEESLKSHTIVFAAEHARKTKMVINIQDFQKA